LDKLVRVVYTLPLLVLLASILGKPANAQELKVAAIDWCPQICPDSAQQPGYIVEILTKVFADSDIRLTIDHFPWSRAINNVKSGKYQALLAPAKKEAPELYYPKIPIGIQTMCFYTLDNSDWIYTGFDSLKGKHIGLAEDTSIEELNPYIKRHPEQFQLQPYHERYIVQNVRKLAKHRMDAFLFTQNTTHYVLGLNPSLPRIREAGCVSEAPVYFALTAQPTYRKHNVQIQHIFERRMLQLLANGEINDILSKYNVKFSAQELLDKADDI